MISGYEKALQRYEMEAQLVLEAHGLPTQAPRLIEKYYPVRNRLVFYAQLVILGAYHLRKEIEKNRIHYALNRLLSVCEAYGDMNFYSNADAFDKNLQFTDWEIYQSMNQGKKSLDNRRKAASIQSQILLERNLEIQDFVNKKAWKIKNRTWKKLQELAAEHFDLSTRTIRTYVDNPYKNKKESSVYLP